MRIISMVPSWTETLISCGLDVVGRTRYCIHPDSEIKIVGGTKDWNIDLIRSLHPDFILLDREENTKDMFEAWPEKCVVTHVERVEDLAPEIAKLAALFENKALADIAERWVKVAALPIMKREALAIPSVLKWIRKPEGVVQNIIYIIWKNPWMAVNENTFIASMLQHLGTGDKMISNPKKYYEFDMNGIPLDSLLLFSSEPYPFMKKQTGIAELGLASAIVNGEDYSWFGIRSLEFLERNKRCDPL